MLALLYTTLLVSCSAQEPLESGRWIERSLEEGGVSRFELFAQAGDRLELMAVGAGFDLTLGLRHQQGTPLAESDFAPKGELELLTFDVEESGVLTIEVTASQGSGSFQLCLARCAPLPGDSRAMLREWIHGFPSNGPMLGFAEVQSTGRHRTWIRGSAEATTASSADESTLFGGEQFEALLLMLATLHLMDELELSLHTPVRELAPDLQGLSEEVLLSQVLRAQAGIRNLPSLALLGEAEGTPAANRERLLQILRLQQDTDFRPGTQKSGSNQESRQLVLEVILEAQTGRAYREYLSEVVFPALGLRDSEFAHGVPSGGAQVLRYGEAGWTGVSQRPTERETLWISTRDWRTLVSTLHSTGEQSHAWSWAAAHYERDWANGYVVSRDGQRRALFINHYARFPYSLSDLAFEFWNGSTDWPLWIGPTDDVIGLGGAAGRAPKRSLQIENAETLQGRYRSPELGFEIAIVARGPETHVEWPNVDGNHPLYWAEKQQELRAVRSHPRFRAITVEESRDSGAQVLRVHGWRYANLRFERVAESAKESDD